LEEELRNNPEKAEKEKQIELEIQKKIEEEKYMINIKDFINENYLYLPANKHDSKYKLIKAL